MKARFRVSCLGLALGCALGLSGAANAFDTQPWSPGPLNTGGLGTIPQAFSKMSAANAQAAAVGGVQGHGGRTVSPGSLSVAGDGCVVNVGGIVGNSVSGNGTVLITEVTGDIIQVCR